jgi:hypothetical protein
LTFEFAMGLKRGFSFIMKSEFDISSVVLDEDGSPLVIAEIQVGDIGETLNEVRFDVEKQAASKSKGVSQSQSSCSSH